MKKHRIRLAFATALLLAITITAPSLIGSAASADTAIDLNDLFTGKDTEIPDASKAIAIAFAGGSADIGGAGAAFADGALTITQNGVYLLSGTLDDGRIVVKPSVKGNVFLIFSDLHVTCSSGAALTISGTKKSFIYLAAGTENSVADGGAQDDEETAAIYSKDDLTFNGEGRLIVTGTRNDAIACKDTLKFVGGTYEITAADDGIVARDALIIGGGEFSIVSEGDAIKTTNDEEAGMGYAIVTGGELSIKSGGGSANASTDVGWGYWGASEDNSSAKGIKTVGDLTLTGGTMTFDTSDDALHCAGTLKITGGEYLISSGDDGVHSDNTAIISGGRLTVTKSYEALEAVTITISGGELSLTASDDGINGAGGNDESSLGGRKGMNFFSSGNAELTVSGGKTYVYARGDGVDVNGAITMTGGELYISGPENSGNGALDYDSAFALSGGTLVAVGAAGMAQAPSEVSVAGIVTSASGKGGVTLSDGSGNTLISFEQDGYYESVIIYSELLTDGESYTLSAGGKTASLNASTAVVSTGGFGGFGWQDSRPGGGGGRK